MQDGKQDEPCDCPNLPGVSRPWFREKEPNQGSLVSLTREMELGVSGGSIFLEPEEIPSGVYS